jgi:hypothetical protein
VNWNQFKTLLQTDYESSQSDELISDITFTFNPLWKIPINSHETLFNHKFIKNSTGSQNYEVYNVYIFFSKREKEKVHDPTNLMSPTINTTTFQFEQYHHRTLNETFLTFQDYILAFLA